MKLILGHNRLDHLEISSFSFPNRFNFLIRLPFRMKEDPTKQLYSLCSFKMRYYDQKSTIKHPNATLFSPPKLFLVCRCSFTFLTKDSSIVLIQIHLIFAGDDRPNFHHGGLDRGRDLEADRTDVPAQRYVVESRSLPHRVKDEEGVFSG